MKQVAFADLECLPAIKQYEAAFRKATGVSLKVVPPGEPGQRISFGKSENAFCTLMGGAPAGCTTCLEVHGRAQRNAARRLVQQQVYCFAGLTVVAVRVPIGKRHVAMVLSGRVFRREPTERDFNPVVKSLRGGLNGDWDKKVRKACFKAPIPLKGGCGHDETAAGGRLSSRRGGRIEKTPIKQPDKKSPHNDNRWRAGTNHKWA